VGFRFASDLLLLVLSASLLQVAFPGWTLFGRLPAGGNVGLFFGELLRGLFSTPGSFLVGLTVIGLLLIGRASFSFIDFCKKLQSQAQFAQGQLIRLWNYFVSTWRRASELRAQQSRLRLETAQATPSVDPNQAILDELSEEQLWVPGEQTGAPPLAVADSLRRSFRLHFDESELEEAGSVTGDGSFADSSVSASTSPQHEPGQVQSQSSSKDSVTKTEQGIAIVHHAQEGMNLREKARPIAEGETQTQKLLEEEDDGLIGALVAGSSAAPDVQALETMPLERSVNDRIGADVELAPSATPEQTDSDVSSVEFLSPEMPPCESDLEGASEEGIEDALDPPAHEWATEPPPLKVPSMESREAKIVDTSDASRIVSSRRAIRPRKKRDYVFPETALLQPTDEDGPQVDHELLLEHAALLEKTLADYGVTGKVEEIHPGPTVTTYEVAPAPGTKVSKVAGLSDDLALGLSRKVRIIAPIPGKSRIGFELPNDERVPVNLRELVEDARFQRLAEKAPLPCVLGRDIVGAPLYADLAGMPHVIVAGATGAGKSVGLNVMLSSLLFTRSPEDLRLLMIDPKVVELAPFDKIPHLLLPVVTDMKQANLALKWAVDEMERRYQLFADAGTKNITTYNRYVKRVAAGEVPPPKSEMVESTDENGEMVMIPASKNGSDGVELPEKMPYIVIVVDEFADLIMQQGKEVEASVARLAQKARAAGMHVILATQRPSVDVITGMIKANFPSRIAYRVAQKVDSRTILDEMGAEVLLGRGDMLVKLNGSTDTSRVQCPFVSEEEVSDLTAHLRTQGEPQYQESILEEPEADEIDPAEEKVDARFDEAVAIVRDTGRCSTSWLQRKLTVGYNRAAKMVEMMENRGYVGPANGSKDREVYLPSP
ncbi:MAG: DNA translocase FtsK, partial [Polyangiaceae bacterium]|nr:DNA translocase FtsK [Polyangiaceae bacterium]